MLELSPFCLSGLLEICLCFLAGLGLLTQGLGCSSGSLMASEAGALPEGQLDRNTVAVDFLLSRSRALETRLDSLGEGVAGLASLCSDWEARLLQLESSLAWISSQVVLFDSKQQAFEHSFSRPCLLCTFGLIIFAVSGRTSVLNFVTFLAVLI